MANTRASALLIATVFVLVFFPTPGPVSGQVRPAVNLPMPGIQTFHPVTTTVALGSNAAPEAMPALKKAGFDVVIAIREDVEDGYDRRESERAAVGAGLKFIAIPFTRAKPDPAAVRKFLEVMAAPENSHAYIYCHEGPRAATMWLIKRVRQDGWTLERAMVEAESLGLKRPELKKFATDFLAGR
ncbi:MAG: beta-lactamase hydrolase domain-containing protein [Vicinamibacterales bacterium]